MPEHKINFGDSLILFFTTSNSIVPLLNESDATFFVADLFSFVGRLLGDSITTLSGWLL